MYAQTDLRLQTVCSPCTVRDALGQPKGWPTTAMDGLLLRRSRQRRLRQRLQRVAGAARVLERSARMDRHFLDLWTRYGWADDWPPGMAVPSFVTSSVSPRSSAFVEIRAAGDPAGNPSPRRCEQPGVARWGGLRRGVPPQRHGPGRAAASCGAGWAKPRPKGRRRSPPSGRRAPCRSRGSMGFLRQCASDP